MPDPRFDELWQRVEEAFDDDAAHNAFLEHCRLTQQLGDAAARYRQEVQKAAGYRADTTRVEAAQKRLKAVALLAVMDLEARSLERPPDRRAVIAKWGAALVLGFWTIYALFKFILR